MNKQTTGGQSYCRSEHLILVAQLALHPSPTIDLAGGEPLSSRAVLSD